MLLLTRHSDFSDPNTAEFIHPDVTAVLVACPLCRLSSMRRQGPPTSELPSKLHS